MRVAHGSPLLQLVTHPPLDRVIVCVRVCCAPVELSVTMHVTVLVVAEAYVCVGLCPLPVPPSPKLQAKVCGPQPRSYWNEETLKLIASPGRQATPVVHPDAAP